MSSTTKEIVNKTYGTRSRRELTEEQRNIQEQARTVVKILGLLDTLNEFNLGHIKDACDRRMKAYAFPGSCHSDT